MEFSMIRYVMNFYVMLISLCSAENRCRIAEMTDSHTKSLGQGPHSTYNVNVAGTVYQA